MQAQLKYAEAIEALKEEVRNTLTRAERGDELLVLIDTLERLGLAYHFEQEIEDILITSYPQKDCHDLFITALRFRLLRQHRHYVSCGVFNKFKGEDNKFKETLSNDAKGLLSLYEAAHLRIHGEQILDEAVAFTVHHLKRMVQQLESPLQDQVKRALEQPLHRGIPRIETRYYISLYEKDSSKDELLLKLAKLDFNYVQNMYKNELREVSRWWDELNPDLPYARNRVVEAYLWGLAYHYEPQYSYVRVAVGKYIQMLTVLDDTYDNYATPEEGDLFAELLERWNIDEIDQLPDYMKLIYRCVLRMYDDYERDAAEKEKLFAVPYAKQTVKEICRAHSQALKWTMGEPMSSFENYVANSVITSVLYVTCSATIPGVKSVNKETIDWLKSEPKIVRASAMVCRYLDDLGSHERESHEGTLLTGLDFYMKHHGLSMQETKDKFVELAEDSWKDLNTEWIMLKTSKVPKDMVEEVLGYARAAEVFYRNREDGYAKPEVMAPLIDALFLDPMII
ncbi:gamma-cadinene synthase [Phtheirospermum japonicum]|uniref:Gamma-cadinene synthase n=1 Tax=Phtheirospermum japonicum TaxID=374723 RepID=A0A830CS47_9LAMI|nr:gamma-cadinene synthase [Phtheirospermum japonicum]